jgi:membrane protease YdiL (CAAX protease family)
MSEAGALLILGVFAILLLIMGWHREFFVLPQKEWKVPIGIFHLVLAFFLYFLITLSLTTVVVKFFGKEIKNNFVGASTWLNFIVSSLTLLSLITYLRSINAPVRKGIWHRQTDEPCIKEDFWYALYAWVLAFPLVMFLSQTLEQLLLKIFQITQLPDQAAVKFLKATFDNPSYFTLAVLAIVVLAPLIEEILFRGLLQTYIRQHIGSKQAIVVSAMCFSLFHYTAGQGLGNVSIIISLFILALFLGFIYEKRGSLFAPIFLHSLFNTVSVANLYLFGGLSSGI